MKNKYQFSFNFNEFSLAQERQENVQKIVLEGTERMEDQVRYRIHTIKHHQAQGMQLYKAVGYFS